MTELKLQILKYINEKDGLDSDVFAKENKLDHEVVKAALNSLLIKFYVQIKNQTEDKYILSKDGEEAATNGTLEFQAYMALEDGPVLKDDLDVKIDF